MMLDTLPLDGVPYEVAKCFGMPHVGAFYSSSSVHSHKREEDARCAVCKAMATNAHHEPPKGMGGKYRRFLLCTPMGQFVLKPALIALCGSGTTGCHGDRHNGNFKIRWEWDEEQFEENWWNGHFLSHGFKPHDKRLYSMGRWVVTFRDGTKFEIREEM